MMRFFSLSAVLAAAIFSAVTAIPFVGEPRTVLEGSLDLELRMASARPGFVQVYHPDEAGALSESRSAKAPLIPGTASHTYRLSLPPGDFSFLRLDPISRAGQATIESVRIVRSSGRVVREIRFSDLRPGQQIDSIHERGSRLEISTTPGGDDPQLTIQLTPPLTVPVAFASHFSKFGPLWLSIFSGLCMFLWTMERVTRARPGLPVRVRRIASQPGPAVALAALIAVVASAYPIIFLGKSHVSPNFNTPLLYDDFPTVPGATHTVAYNTPGADVGAMMWAHLPYSVVEHRAILHGELPLWNRYNSLGSPLLGQGQSMLGDPLHLAVVLCKGAAWAWDLKFIVAKWLFAFGLGLLVFHLTRHLPSAIVVAVAAPFIGFFVYRINHAAYFSLCYAPWPLLCWVRVTQAQGRRAVAGWAAALLLANFTLLNSGTVKEAYLLLLMMNFSGACVLVSSRASWFSRLGKLAALAWAGLIFILLSAPVWSTFMHTLANARTNYDAGSAYQIQPSLLLGAFDEAFFRLLTPGEAVFNPALNFLLLLGLLYFVATLRALPPDRAQIALAASSLIPFALVFGIIPPSWIIAVPLLGHVQHIDNTFLCALIVLWSVLAGAGFARAAARLGTPAGRGDLVAVASGLFIIIGAWIAFRQAAHRGAFGPGMTFSVLQHGQVLPVSRFVWGYLATLIAASAVLGLAIRHALRHRALTPAVGIMIALGAILLLWRHGLHAEVIRFETHVVRPPPRADLHAPSPAMNFVRAAHAREPGRGFGLHNNFFPGWTGVYGLESINGPDALMNPWFRELIAASGIRPGISWDFSVPIEQFSDVRPFLDALNVRFYFDRGHDEATLRKSLHAAATLDLDVWESLTAWPRAFFTDRIFIYEQPVELVQAIKAGDGRAFAAVQREGMSALPAMEANLKERAVTPAANYRLTENTTAFDVHARAPGVVVLSESFWPGDFRAELNGRKVPVLRLNHAFKGIAINVPGNHHVIFRYVPRNFPRNLLFCGIGAVLLGLSLVIAMRNQRVGHRP